MTVLGLVLLTGPVWGAAIGYGLAVRGYRLRSPFVRGDDHED